ncbi:vacuolar transporter chaperone 1 [Apiospora arundinis]
MGFRDTLATLLCLTLFLLPLVSSQEPQSNTSACHYRSDWVKRLSSGYFHATEDCSDLNYILQAVNKNKKKMDFCSAKREHVFGYIREGLLPTLGSKEDKKRQMPEDCEIERWWYEGKYPKSRQPFCKTASRIAATPKDNKNRTKLVRSEPYRSLIHGPRSQCSLKLRQDLETIGNPDVAGPGVMASYVIQLLLLVFFSFSVLYRDGSLASRRADRSFLVFYGTSMILALSVAIASAVTFAQKRAAPGSLRNDLRFPEIYEYRLLALAPAFALLPVLAAHTHHEARQRRRASSRRQILLPRVLTGLVCILCVIVIWVIWTVGGQGRESSVRFVFGGQFNVQINPFLYQRAGNYTQAIAILTTVLPVLGLASIMFSHRPDVDWPALMFRVICILLALAEVVMLFYIRTLAIKDGQGKTSEVEVSFGQILACFTWFPVLFALLFGLEFPGVDEAPVGAPQGALPYQGNYMLQNDAP